MLPPDGYQSALEQAVVAGRPGRGTIALTGRDRAALLHNLLTNEIAGLAPGTGCYSAYLTPQGRMIADMRVVIRDDRVLLDVELGVKDDLLERLDRSIFAEDVKVLDLTASTAVVRVAGPHAARVVSSAIGVLSAGRVVDESLSLLNEYDSREWSLGQGSVVIVRDDSLGVSGFDVLVPDDRGAELVRACRTAGALDVQEETLEVLRIEAGRPRFGVDMSHETIPLEAGIEKRAISFTKGCYPGQEVIIRVLHRGHGRVARRLVGVIVDGSVVPAGGNAVQHGQQPVGRVTSAAWSPAVGKPIALAYIRREESEPGTQVSVVHDDVQLPATVTVLPFRSPKP